VTGASRGVGAAVAIALAEAGADVVLAARSTTEKPHSLPGTLEATAAAIEKLGRKAVCIPTNLAKEDEVAAMVAGAVDAFGRIDILVNNAAVAVPNDGTPLGRKHFDLLFAVNTRAPMAAMREAALDMGLRGEGAIVNISSAAAVYRVPSLTAYGMSKIALEHLTVMASDELRPRGISVNCFRIDIGTASEGLLARSGAADHPGWVPPSVAAEGVLWVLRQPAQFTGHIVSMAELRRREGIMQSQADDNPPGSPIFPADIENAF
jgi:NAD(P)-dependent dehydrogenase (short-subunit alcohol dehydrogenase family)